MHLERGWDNFFSLACKIFTLDEQETEAFQKGNMVWLCTSKNNLALVYMMNWNEETLLAEANLKTIIITKIWISVIGTERLVTFQF